MWFKLFCYLCLKRNNTQIIRNTSYFILRHHQFPLSFGYQISLSFQLYNWLMFTKHDFKCPKKSFSYLIITLSYHRVSFIFELQTSQKSILFSCLPPLYQLIFNPNLHWNCSLKGHSWMAGLPLLVTKSFGLFLVIILTGIYPQHLTLLKLIWSLISY